jgi:hypothetical protein
MADVADRSMVRPPPPAGAPMVPEFSIVPLGALPVVGVVLVGLIAAIQSKACGPSTSSPWSGAGCGRASTSSALLAYLIEAGMLEYVFVLDHTRGSVLVVLTLMLAIFAVTIPMLLAFTVARYQPVQPARQV